MSRRVKNNVYNVATQSFADDYYFNSDADYFVYSSPPPIYNPLTFQLSLLTIRAINPSIYAAVRYRATSVPSKQSCATATTKNTQTRSYNYIQTNKHI